MKFMKNKVTVLALAMFMMLSMTACKGDSGANETGKATETLTTTEDAAKQTTEEPATAEPTEDAETTTASDAEIPENPEKIISVAPNITEMLYEMGAGDKLIARTDYCDYPEQCLELESIGSLYTPDIEKMISLQPDVVLASTHFTEDTETKLTSAGIPVQVLYEETSFEGVYDMIKTLGDLVNCEAEAERMVSDMKEKIQTVTDKVAGLEKPTVYYVVSFGEGGEFTATGETFIHEMITLAGGDNIAKNGTDWSYSLEALLEADPYIILIDEESKDGFMASEAHQNLTAVKEGRVYGIDGNMLDRQGYRNAEVIETMAKIFYPEAF